MNTIPWVHPEAATLAAFALGRLPPEEQSLLEQHIQVCAECCRHLAHVEDDSLLQLAQEAAATPDALTPSLPAFPPELLDHPRYRLLAPLGQGGMGVVYKAEHRLMGRLVALKVLNRSLTSDADAVERFRREVKAVARLCHPNIVTSHDADEANGLHFLVMEYVEGMSLDRVVARQGPLPVRTACNLIRQAALGLQHAFEQGMVHRDVKPQNLMVTRSRQVKVLDFGLARLARTPGPVAQGRIPTLAGGVTAPSLVVGTPDYLSPEQAVNSSAVDIRADLYSLGCTLYFLLTGRVPFPSQSVMEKLLAHAQDEPEDVRSLRPDVPAELATVVRRLMAKSPGQRFATPGEAAAALLPFQRSGRPAPSPVETAPAPSSTPSETRETPRKRTRGPSRRGPGISPALRRLGVLAVGLGVLAAAGVGLATLLTDRSEPTGQAPGAGSPAHVLILVPRHGLWYQDYGPVRQGLDRQGVRVTVASSASGTSTLHQASMGGEPVPIDRVADAALASDRFDAVVLVGFEVFDLCRWGPAGPHVKKLLEGHLRDGRLVAAICTGQEVLASHGLLAGRKAAFNDKVAQRHPDLNWQRERVVLSDGILTAGHADDAGTFLQALLEALGRPARQPGR